MWELSLRSIDYSFASPDEKNNLKLKWNEWYRKRNISGKTLKRCDDMKCTWNLLL